METKISVLLADPGEQYRAAYSKAIGQETDMELVAQTDNGLRAEELITKFQPDVVVLDLVLPNLDGLSLLTHLRAKNASSRVIVTSAICNDQVLMECAELGTTYFMQKPLRLLHPVPDTAHQVTRESLLVRSAVSSFVSKAYLMSYLKFNGFNS